MATSQFLDAALEHASRGLRVFPLRPLTKNGQYLKRWKDEATTDPLVIIDWWTTWPEANIGCALAHHFVIDVDTAKGGKWREERTLAIGTPSGGLHYWFAGEAGRNSSGRLAKGVDTRASDAGYVLLPPSRVRYDDGREGEYQLLADLPPAAIPLDVLARLAAEAKERTEGRVFNPGSPEHVWALKQAESACAQELKAHGPAVEGESSDDRAYRVAVRLRGIGLDEYEIAETMCRHWAPHFDETWLETKVGNGLKYAQNAPGSEYQQTAAERFGIGFGHNSRRAKKPDSERPAWLHRGGTPGHVDWLWKHWIPQGMITLLAGDTSDGKTTMVLELAAKITGGGKFPDGSEAPRGDVLLWCGEDDYERVMLPRLIRMGADKERCYHVDAMPTEEKPDEWRSFTPSRDMPKLDEATDYIPNLLLTLLDPIVRATGGKARDSNNNLDVREGMDPVKTFAERTQSAVIGISHHSKKSDDMKAAHRVTGSLAWGAVTRTLLSTACVDAEAQIYRLVRAKNNVGPDGGAFEYTKRVDNDIAYIEWGDYMPGRPEGLLRGDERQGAVINATRFLRGFLMHNGAVIPLGLPVRDIMEAATAHSVNGAALKRAKEMLEKKGELLVWKSNVWHWRLRGAAETFQGQVGVDPSLELGSLL